MTSWIKCTWVSYIWSHVLGFVKRTQTTNYIKDPPHTRLNSYKGARLYDCAAVATSNSDTRHPYFHLWTTDIKKNGLWWPKQVLSFSNNHSISDLHCTVFPNNSSTGLNTTHKVIFYTMLKSLLGNAMLYNSWVHVLHITYFWSPTIYWKPSVTNHFDLFIINKDDNQHVFQSCIGLVNMEPLMANTMSTDCFRKKWMQS